MTFPFELNELVKVSGFDRRLDVVVKAGEDFLRQNLAGIQKATLMTERGL
jgi:hypothetical protein